MNQGLIIMRPTEDCNLACQYCYSTKSSDTHIMSEKTLEESIKKILGFYKNITFVWHGGESTVVGLDFIRLAVEFQKRYRRNNQKVINEIQTNGTLINEEWADFFHKNSFFIGISIDGPKEINDLVRVDREGIGTFDRIYQGISILRKHDLKIAGICVLAKHNVNNINAIFDFYAEHNISLNINPFIRSGMGSLFNEKLMISPIEFSKAMINLFNLWFENPVVKIYDFYKIIKSFLTASNNICCYSGKCSSEYISICPNGDVYPCGRWAGEKSFCMGNITKNPMETIINSIASKALLNRQTHLEECQICDWYEVCRGGCPHTSFIYTGSIYNRDFYCEGRKILFSHIYNCIKESIDDARKATLFSENVHGNELDHKIRY